MDGLLSAIDGGHAALLPRMDEDLALRGLSANTRESYLTHARLFLEFCHRPADALTTEDIRRCLRLLLAERGVAASTANVDSAALRFLFAVTLNRPLNSLQIPRAKHRKALPYVLSRRQIADVLAQCATPKHRALCALIDGSGLRVSEAASLHVADIDSAAMRVFVAGGKGNKDRYTILSQMALEALRDDWRASRPQHPDGWLFPGPGASGHITPSGISLAFEQAVCRAGITAPVSIHTLRHCFATHLLEDGATLLQIKDLRGHASLHSTTVYLHLANLTAGETILNQDLQRTGSVSGALYAYGGSGPQATQGMDQMVSILQEISGSIKELLRQQKKTGNLSLAPPVHVNGIPRRK
jgi:site-specific recombinase XerD